MGSIRGVANALVLAMVVSVLTVPPVWATGGSYGWSRCNWETSGVLEDGRVWVRAPGYPADSWGDNVLNSFKNRINEAITTWDHALDQAGYSRPTRILRMADNGIGEDILVHQWEFGAGSSTWGDNTNYASGSCTMHSTVSSPMQWAEIRTDVHPGWWTQQDSRRAYWEGCPSRNFVPAYTCSKNRDFEGLLAHELGHAMGLPHPESVDTHDPPLSPNAATVASCSNNLDYATMCGPRTYRTTAQTLHPWDRESFRIIEVQH